jgi:glutaredoxin-like protein NrdH
MKLKQRNIEFSAVRLDQDAAAVDAVKALGYAAAPVVVVDLGDGASWSWQGFRPSEIEKLEKVLAGADPEVVFAA